MPCKCKLTKKPTFGLENDKKPTCCKKCKTDVMINLRNSKEKNANVVKLDQILV